jgi:hypothetical protein
MTKHLVLAVLASLALPIAALADEAGAAPTGSNKAERWRSNAARATVLPAT